VKSSREGRPAILWNDSSTEEKLLWLYTALIPFVSVWFFRLNDRGRRLGFADLVLGILVLVWSAKCLRRRRQFTKTWLELPIVLMVCLFSISLVNSVSLRDSFIDLAILLSLIALFLAIINVFDSHQKLRRLLYAYVLVSAGLCLIGIISVVVAMSTGIVADNDLLYYRTLEKMAHHFPRVKLTLQGPNMLLTYLHVALVLATILLLTESKHKRRILIAVAVITIFATSLLTGSRRIAGLLLTVFLLLCFFGRGKPLQVARALSLVVFLAVLIGSVIVTVWAVFPIEISRDEEADRITVSADSSYSPHLIPHIATLNMIKKHPIVGVGFGTFRSHFGESLDWQWLRDNFGLDAYPEALRSIEEGSFYKEPHSLVLGAFAESGAVGVFGLAVFLTGFTILLVKRFSQAEYPEPQRVVSGCILAGFIGFLLNGLTIDILWMRHFWLMMAVGLAANHVFPRPIDVSAS
jgi:O-antigen ligase